MHLLYVLQYTHISTKDIHNTHKYAITQASLTHELLSIQLHLVQYLMTIRGLSNETTSILNLSRIKVYGWMSCQRNNVT